MYEYNVYSKKVSYENQEIIKEKGKVLDYAKPKDDDDDIEYSPTEGTMKVPKPLTIKIPTETAQTGDEPDSPVYIPGVTNQGPTSPEYIPTSPAYDPNNPSSPTFGPNDPNPFTNTIQEVNLSDITPEK